MKRLDELIAHHSKDCAKIGYGKCATARCMKRGGWKPGDSGTYEGATCEALETVEILREVRATWKSFDCYGDTDQ